MESQIYALRTTAKREDQVIDFIDSNVKKKKLQIFSVVRIHGMSSYVFIEAASEDDARQSFMGVPYAKGLLPKPLNFSEIEPMLEQVKTPVHIQVKDIVEIIQGPFKRNKARVKKIDDAKDEVVVELLEAAIPIPITIKIEWVRVIRRDTEDESGAAQLEKKEAEEENRFL